jgi:hypothetical protein
MMPAKDGTIADLEFLKLKGDSGSHEPSSNSNHTVPDDEDAIPVHNIDEHNHPPPSDRSNAPTPRPSPVAHRTRARLRSTSQTSSTSSNEEDPDGTIIHQDPFHNDSDTSDDEMAMLSSLNDPKTVQEALAGSDASEWQAAIDKEMASIESFNTYTLHDPSEIPRGTRPIGSQTGSIRG